MASRYYREFTCSGCGLIEYRWQEWKPAEKPVYKGDEDPLPVHCEGCGAEMFQDHAGISMDLLPESFVVDAQTIGREEPGQVRISSLSEIRKIERESERKAANGEGQIIAFREFSQGRSNRGSNVFSGSSFEKGKSRRPEKRKTVSDLPITVSAYKN